MQASHLSGGFWLWLLIFGGAPGAPVQPAHVLGVPQWLDAPGGFFAWPVVRGAASKLTTCRGCKVWIPQQARGEGFGDGLEQPSSDKTWVWFVVGVATWNQHDKVFDGVCLLESTVPGIYHPSQRLISSICGHYPSAGSLFSMLFGIVWDGD
jgi:hypothetical protein